MNHLPDQMKPVTKFALATAMRRGEIAKLTWQDINKKSRYALLRETKNSIARKAPLSDEALAIIDAMPRKLHDNLIFAISPQAVFQKRLSEHVSQRVCWLKIPRSTP